MAITGPASYIPTMNEFLGHWQQCNNALPPGTPLLVRLPDSNTTVSRTQFFNLRASLLAQQGVVQSCLTDQQIARGGINLQKAALLGQFNEFTTRLDASYRNTDFYDARPYAPSLSDGQENFTRPLLAAMKLWEKLNSGTAPAGVVLPLELVPDNVSVGSFASAVSSLQFAYANEQDKEQIVTIARSKRNRLQNESYAVMKAYRENLPGSKVAAFPELVETMPRLTPLAGHTPAPVNSSAIFEAPNASKVVYDASPEATLHSYELRGNVGEEFSDEDAVVIATNAPGAPREFVTPFGLNQPGAQVALKVYVILSTGNEAGSGAMFVQRPASLGLAA